MQVLSNPELRARYDQHGEDGLDVNFMDGAEFFTMLFGCDRFEHLVGELMLATLARVGDKATPAQLEKVRVSTFFLQYHVYHDKTILCPYLRCFESSCQPSW